MELVEVGPSMNLIVRRHRLPNESLLKEAMKMPDQAKKVNYYDNLYTLETKPAVYLSVISSHY
jgi:hypothetical protein